MKPNLKENVITWLENKDFDAGIAILAAHRPQMARIFAGREKTYAGKLAYELKKLAGISELQRLEKNPKPEPKTRNPEPKTKNPETKNQKPGTRNPEPKTKNPKPGTRNQKTGTPPFIAKIVKEHSRLFKLRSQLADERLIIPAKNHPTYNKKRKILSESIQQHSERIEALYQAKEDYYEKGITPDMEALFPAIQTEPEPKTKKQKPGTKS